MSPIGSIKAVEVLIVAAVLLWFFYGPWQKFVVDVLRQNLFQLRDEIFDLVHQGELEFESGEYKAIRERFNLMIRYAHDATWSHVCGVVFVLGDKFENDAERFDLRKTIATVQNPIARAKILDAYRKAMVFTVMAIIARSIFLIIVYAISTPFVLIAALVDAKAIWKNFGKPIGRAIERDIDIEGKYLRPA